MMLGVRLRFSQTYLSESLVSGNCRTRASEVLEQLDDQTRLTSKARYTICQLSIWHNEKIAVHITICGPKTEEILERDLKVKEYWLHRRNLSETDNFGFRVEEHISLGARYDQCWVGHSFFG